MEVEKAALSETSPLHADKRGTELNDKERRILALTLEALGNHINTYWAQRQWRLGRFYTTPASRKDVYDPNVTVHFRKAEEFDAKVIEELKRTLNSCGFQVVDTEKNYLILQINQKKMKKTERISSAGEKILKKRKVNKQPLLDKIDGLVKDSVYQNKCDRYDFSFVGFDPKLISQYLEGALLSNSGFALKPPKTFWKSKIVKINDEDSLIVYRPVTQFSLISTDINCFALRSRIRCLTNCYEKTFQFGGGEREI